MRKMIIAVLSIIVLSSCQKTIPENKEYPSAAVPNAASVAEKAVPAEIDLEKTEKMNQKEIESLIESHLRQNMKSHLSDPLNIIIADYAGKFMEGDSLSFIAYVDHSGFNFKEGIFERVSGRMSPIEVKYIKNTDNDKENIYSFKEVIYPIDGTDYEKSILEMTRQNQEILNKLKESEKNQEQTYYKMMDHLKIEADKAGLKNYQHKVNEVPGFDKGVQLIENSSIHIKDTIQIISKSDYERLKNVSSGEKSHTETADGVLYDKKTGIAVRDILYADMLP